MYTVFQRVSGAGSTFVEMTPYEGVSVVVCEFTTAMRAVAEGASEYVVPEMVRAGPPGRRVCGPIT